MITNASQSAYLPIIANGLNVTTQSSYIVLLNPVVTVTNQTSYAVFYPSVTAPISASLNVTDSDNILASSGELSIQSNSILLDGNDTTTTSAKVQIRASISYTDFDTLYANTRPIIHGSSVTSISDTMVGSFSLTNILHGSLTYTDAPDGLLARSYRATARVNYLDHSDVLTGTAIIFNHNTDMLIVRRGLERDLPQLDNSELGFTIDTSRIFLGSGNRNIEILTELSTEALARHHGKRKRISDNRDYTLSYLPSGYSNTPRGDISGSFSISGSSTGWIAIRGSLQKPISISFLAAGYHGDEPSGWGESWGNDW